MATVNVPTFTDRQLEVAECLDEGMTMDEIGEKLGISPRTVKAHVDVLKHKLGVTRKRLVAPTMRHLDLI